MEGKRKPRTISEYEDSVSESLGVGSANKEDYRIQTTGSADNLLRPTMGTLLFFEGN